MGLETDTNAPYLNKSNSELNENFTAPKGAVLTLKPFTV